MKNTTTDYRCPECGTSDLCDGSFDYEGLNGTRTHTPSPLHFECMECEWSGNDAAEASDYHAMLEDKADARHEERKLAEYESIMASIPGSC